MKIDILRSLIFCLPKMSGWLITLIIVIVLILIVAMVIIFSWSSTVKKAFTIPPAQDYTEAGFGMRCSLTATQSSSLGPLDFIPPVCADGLTCLKFKDTDEWGYCYKSIGTVDCGSLSECELAATICSKVCATGFHGVGQPCSSTDECDSANLICDLSDHICRYKENEICLTDSQCYGTTCHPIQGDDDNSYCIPRRVNGSACDFDYECLDGSYCDVANGGYCQTQDTSTGNALAACRLLMTGDLPKCNSGNPTCAFEYTEWDSTILYGLCAVQEPEWDATLCSASLGCIPPTLCFNSHCVMPRTITALKTNSCGAGTTGLCAPGYSCVSEVCVASAGNPAATGSYQICFWTPGTNSIGTWNLHSYTDFNPDPSDASSPLTALTAVIDATGVYLLYSVASKGIVLLKGGASYPILFTFTPIPALPIGSTQEDPVVVMMKFLPSGTDAVILYAFNYGSTVSHGLVILDISTFYTGLADPNISYSAGIYTINVSIPYADSGGGVYTPIPIPELSAMNFATVIDVNVDHRFGDDLVQVYYIQPTYYYLTYGARSRYFGDLSVPSLGVASKANSVIDWQWLTPYLRAKANDIISDHSAIGIVGPRVAPYTNYLIGTPIDEYPTLYDPTPTSITRLHVSYPVGAIPPQVYYTYLAEYSGVYELHSIIANFDRVMPGYFNSQTLICYAYPTTSNLIPVLCVMTNVA